LRDENVPRRGYPRLPSGECDSLAVWNNAYTLVHRECVERSLGGQAEAVGRNKASGSYFTGILGALLGVIVGTIPNILAIYYLETVWSVLFALIPSRLFWLPFFGRQDGQNGDDLHAGSLCSRGLFHSGDAGHHVYHG
jgi:hypothetical protein